MANLKQHENKERKYGIKKEFLPLLYLLILDIRNFAKFLHGRLKTVEQTYLQAVDVDSNISWEAYHANQQPADDSPTQCCLSSMKTPSLLP